MRRATDSTDAAASGVLTATGTALTLTGKYTGSLGNGIVATVGSGNQVGTYSVTITCPQLAAETFNNIPGLGNAFWQNVANAINLGHGGQHGDDLGLPHLGQWVGAASSADGLSLGGQLWPASSRAPVLAPMPARAAASWRVWVLRWCM